MKEKRYFCNWYKPIIIVAVVVAIVLCIISGISDYTEIKPIYDAEVAAYNEFDFEKLHKEIYNMYDKENKSLNLSNFPTNVTISNVTITTDEITFTYTVDMNFTVIYNPEVFVTISNNYQDILITDLTIEQATFLSMPGFEFFFHILIILAMLMIFIAAVLLLIGISENRRDNNSIKSETGKT